MAFQSIRWRGLAAAGARKASRSLSVLFVALALVTTGWPQLAAASTKVTFYSHGWGVGPNGETVYPHAFIRLEGSPNGGPVIDQTYGFHVRSVVEAMWGRPGVIKPTGGRYLADSQANFWLEISDAQYNALMDRIAWWKTPEGSIYNLRTRTCIDFVADMAAILGLKPGNPRTWDPAKFMGDTYTRNTDILQLPVVSGPAAPDIVQALTAEAAD